MASGPYAPRLYHFRREIQPVPAVLQHPRWVRGSQGGTDPHTGSLPEHLEPCLRHSQTLLVHDAHRKHQRKNQGGRTDAADGRSLYGQSGPGIRDTAENKAHRQSRQRLHRNPPALRRRLRTPADQKHQASAGGYETPVFRCPGPAGRG